MRIGGGGSLFAGRLAGGRAVAAVGRLPGREVVGGEKPEGGDNLGAGKAFGEEGVVEEAHIARHLLARGLTETRGKFKNVCGGHPDCAGQAILLDGRGEGLFGGLTAGEALVAALAGGALAHQLGGHRPIEEGEGEGGRDLVVGGKAVERAERAPEGVGIRARGGDPGVEFGKEHREQAVIVG